VFKARETLNISSVIRDQTVLSMDVFEERVNLVNWQCSEMHMALFHCIAVPFEIITIVFIKNIDPKSVRRTKYVN
jgi:hypothetical protein